jgi:hypothetical protein
MCFSSHRPSPKTGAKGAEGAKGGAFARVGAAPVVHCERGTRFSREAPTVGKQPFDGRGAHRAGDAGDAGDRFRPFLSNIYLFTIELLISLSKRFSPKLCTVRLQYIALGPWGTGATDDKMR